MWRFVSLVCTAIFLFSVAKPQNDKFLKYKSVQAYEVRPGILLMPRYANDGQVCDVALQRTHYSNDVVNLDPRLPRDLIIQIVDELVPGSERGPRTMDFGREYMSEYSGNGVTTFAEYEDLSIDIYGQASPNCCAGDIVATIHWKKRKCQ